MPPPKASAAAHLRRAVAAAPVYVPSAESYNALVWPLGALGVVDPPGMHGAALDHIEGGIDQPSNRRARASIFLGVDATLMGLAERLASRWPPLPAPRDKEPLPPQTLARALVVFNRKYFDIATTAGYEAFPDRWRAGMRVPLPVEIDPATNDWLADREAIDRWAFEFDERWINLLTIQAGRLPLPTPRATIDDATRRAAEAVADSDRFEALVARTVQATLGNPFEPLFSHVEILRALEARGQRLRFCMSVLEKLTVHDVRMLGWTTAGNALLRCFWRTLTTDPELDEVDDDDLQRCRTSVARDGLGLAPAAAAPGFVSPARRGPTVVPRELPLTAGQAKAIKVEKGDKTTYDHEPKAGLHAMLFGRYLHIGTTDSYGRFSGPAYAGHLSPGEFAATCGPELEVGAPALFAARSELTLAIAPIEGLLDAARAADAAFLSTGMQQWSMHVHTEATVLLARYLDRAPDHYEVFFGLWGVQPRICDENGAVDTPAVATDNKDWDESRPPGCAQRGTPTHVTLSLAAPGKDAQLVPLGPERCALFGGVTDAKKNVTFSSDWCARVRLAALVSSDYCIVQLQLAAYRFRRIARFVAGFTIMVDGLPYTPQELCSSKLAAATLLDHHINSPGRVKKDLEAACKRTSDHEAAHDAASGPMLTRAWLLRFAINYLSQRQFGAPRPDWRIKAERDDWILRLHDSGLDPEPGTFGGWE